jgi:hypothetical protein
MHIQAHKSTNVLALFDLFPLWIQNYPVETLPFPEAAVYLHERVGTLFLPGLVEFLEMEKASNF